MRRKSNYDSVRLACLLIVLTLLIGCAGGLYSEYKKEIPHNLSGQAKQLVRKNGAPDEYTSIGNYSLLIWRGGHDAVSIWDKILTGIPFFSLEHKSSIGAVVNNKGKILAFGQSKGVNESQTILGLYSRPVNIADTKR